MPRVSRDGAEKTDECGRQPLSGQSPIEDIAQELRTLDGNLSIDLPHDVANRRNEQRRVARSADVQGDTRLIVLRQRQIEVRGLSAPQCWCRQCRRRHPRSAAGGVSGPSRECSTRSGTSQARNSSPRLPATIIHSRRGSFTARSPSPVFGARALSLTHNVRSLASAFSQ